MTKSKRTCSDTSPRKRAKKVKQADGSASPICEYVGKVDPPPNDAAVRVPRERRPARRSCVARSNTHVRRRKSARKRGIIDSSRDGAVVKGARSGRLGGVQVEETVDLISSDGSDGGVSDVASLNTSRELNPNSCEGQPRGGLLESSTDDFDPDLTPFDTTPQWLYSGGVWEDPDERWYSQPLASEPVPRPAASEPVRQPIPTKIVQLPSASKSVGPQCLGCPWRGDAGQPTLENPPFLFINRSTPYVPSSLHESLSLAEPRLVAATAAPRQQKHTRDSFDGVELETEKLYKPHVPRYRPGSFIECMYEALEDQGPFLLIREDASPTSHPQDPASTTTSQVVPRRRSGTRKRTTKEQKVTGTTKKRRIPEEQVDRTSSLARKEDALATSAPPAAPPRAPRRRSPGTQRRTTKTQKQEKQREKKRDHDGDECSSKRNVLVAPNPNSVDADDFDATID